MAYTIHAPKRPLPPHATSAQRRAYFRQGRMYYFERLRQFLSRYYSMWAEVADLGITSMEAILHLTVILPWEWQEWARERVVPHLQHALIERARGAGLTAFIEVIRDRAALFGYPPVGPHGPGIFISDAIWQGIGINGVMSPATYDMIAQMIGERPGRARE